MTQKQLIETIQQHHPELMETQIRILLNKALDDFCRITGILADVQTFTTVADKRWYALSDLDADADETDQVKIIDVMDVYLDNNRILKLSGTPDVYDST